MKVIHCKKCYKPCRVKVDRFGTLSECCDASVYMIEKDTDALNPLLEKAERIGKIWAAMLLIVAFCLILWLAFKVFAESHQEPPPSKYRGISIERALGNMDIRPESVEIHPDGRLYYIMAGKRYEIE